MHRTNNCNFTYGGLINLISDKSHRGNLCCPSGTHWGLPILNAVRIFKTSDAVLFRYWNLDSLQIYITQFFLLYCYKFLFFAYRTKKATELVEFRLFVILSSIFGLELGKRISNTYTKSIDV